MTNIANNQISLSKETFLSNDSFRQAANLLTVLLALTVNILASTLPLNGQNTGEISDRFQVYFVPAGYVFSIWGIIYIGWIAFTIYQLLPSQKENSRLRRLGYLFALSNLANAAWLFCWHYNQFGLSVLVMLALLGLLIASYLRLNVNRSSVSRTEYWSVDVMFSVYLGWITVATVANITDWLYFIGWEGFGIAAQTWAVIMLAVASLLGLAMALARQDAGYLAVLVWAFIGIAVKQSAAPMVVLSAWTAAALMLGLVIYSVLHRRTSAASNRSM
ncbi:MAG TPA: tryptophan-rich sensory protein [Anaerolineales bacterium]|nr:tryptophan-rich sensory protein [Anaerolineales bacterium]